MLSISANTLSFQGVYSEGGILNSQDTITVSFRFYEGADSDEIIWNETHAHIIVKQGLFSLELGSQFPFGDLDFSRDIWFETVIENIVSKKRPLSKVPLSIHSVFAQEAKELSGKIRKGVEVENDVLVHSINSLKNDISLVGTNGIHVSNGDNSIQFSLDSSVTLHGVQGEDGAKIVDASFSESGDLIFDLDDASQVVLENATNVLRGPQGDSHWTLSENTLLSDEDLTLNGDALFNGDVTMDLNLFVNEDLYVTNSLHVVEDIEAKSGIYLNSDEHTCELINDGRLFYHDMKLKFCSCNTISGGCVEEILFSNIIK